ncbi:MAG: hypothetical protein IKH02_03685 [Prevotella sp.]|nr:hypothetical protein [Prevotella sp.]
MDLKKEGGMGRTPLGKAKKSAIFFAFRSLIRPLPLRGEGTLARESKKICVFFAFRSLIRPLPLRGEGTLARESKKVCDFFCFPLAYSYLCTLKIEWPSVWTDEGI